MTHAETNTAPPLAPDPLASLTVEDVAGLLQLAPKTVRALCKRGELRSVTVARRVRISRAAVAALLAGTTPPSADLVPSAPEPCPLPGPAPRLGRPGRPRKRGRARRSET